MPKIKVICPHCSARVSEAINVNQKKKTECYNCGKNFYVINYICIQDLPLSLGDEIEFRGWVNNSEYQLMRGNPIRFKGFEELLFVVVEPDLEDNPFYRIFEYGTGLSPIALKSDYIFVEDALDKAFINLKKIYMRDGKGKMLEDIFNQEKINQWSEVKK